MKNYYVAYVLYSSSEVCFGCLVKVRYPEINNKNIVHFLSLMKDRAIKNEGIDGHVKVLSWQEVREV